jgi:hypothetical protein
MASSGYVIRTMSRNEIDLAIDWAASEGWNPGLYDADCFYAADPEGFLIGEFNQEPVATISAVKYGETFGFLGFYIVKPAYRGQGYGIQIWKDALKRLSGRNVGLDGVLAQQGNYIKSGFKFAHRNIRYEGASGGIPSENSKIVNLSQVPFSVIEKFDRPFVPDSRSEFLQSWLHQPENAVLGIMQNEKLSGYGMIRPCRAGYKIGPLLADNPELAESLFVALKSKVVPGKPVYLDVPETNRSAVALAERQNMKLVFETARMYTGVFPELPMDRLFGITSFELG